MFGLHLDGAAAVDGVATPSGGDGDAKDRGTKDRGKRKPAAKVSGELAASLDALAAQVATLQLALMRGTSADAPLNGVLAAVTQVGDTLALRAGEPSNADRAAVEEGLAAAHALVTPLATRFGPRSPAETQLLRALAMVQRVAARNVAPDVLAEPPAELRRTLAETAAEFDRWLAVVAAQPDALAQVDVHELHEARGELASWAELDDAELRRRARVILDQRELVAIASAELATLLQRPPTETMQAAMSAYFRALALSGRRRERGQAALAAARQQRQLVRIRDARAHLDESFAAAAGLKDLSSDEGDAAMRRHGRLAARHDALERRILAGQRVTPLEHDELEVLEREAQLRDSMRTIQLELRQAADAIGTLDDGLLGRVNRFSEDIPQIASDLRGLAKVAAAAVAGYDERVEAIEAEHADVADSYNGRRSVAKRKRAALDEVNRLIREYVQGRYLIDRLERAKQVADKAQLRLFIANVIAMLATMVAGNFVGGLARGAAEGAVIARSAGTAIVAAQRIGAVAGILAEGVFGVATQKYIHGDAGSIPALLAVNLITPVVIGRVMKSTEGMTGRLAALEGGLARNGSVWSKVGRGGVLVLREGVELVPGMIVGAAVDYATRRAMSEPAVAPTEQTVTEWLVQGATMAIGKHLSTRVGMISRRLERLELAAASKAAYLAGKAKALRQLTRQLERTPDAADLERAIVDMAHLIDAEHAFLEHELTQTAEGHGTLSQKQLVAMIRANNRARGELVDIAAGEFSGGGGRRSRGGGGGRSPGDGGGGRSPGDGGGGRVPSDDGGGELLQRVDEVGPRATVLVAGTRHEGGSAFSVQGAGGNVPVEVVVGDDSVHVAQALRRSDGSYEILIPAGLSAADVEVALAGKLSEVAHTELRRATGRGEATTDALGPQGKGTEFSPADYALVGELRALQRQQLDAELQGGDPERLASLRDKSAAVEKRMGLDESDTGRERRRMVETQLELEADGLRRESARRRLDGERGHPGVEVHTHWMGIVDVEVFRAKAAIAANGADDGSWVPLLDQIASYDQFEHKTEHGEITRRSPAGDAFAIAKDARDQIRRIRSASDENPEALRAIEPIAETAARAALTATPDTDFNSAYEVRDELVKDTFAGRRSHLPDAAADAADAKRHADAGYDAYTREALVALAKDGVGYTEPSNSGKKLGQRFQRERVERAMEELVAEGKLEPGQVDVRFLAMVTTNHFGERAPGLPGVAVPPGTEASWNAQYEQVVLQLREGHVAGIDIAGQELFHFDPAVAAPRIRALYAELAAAATARGQRLVLRPHVGEGAVDTLDGKAYQRDADRAVAPDGTPTHYERARHNLEVMLEVVDGLRADPIFDGTKVELRFGHAAHATADQAARMHELGITAEVNLGSNVVTGSLDQAPGSDGRAAPVEQLQDHALPSFLYYGTRVILSTDAHAVMATDMRAEYVRARRVIDEVLSGARPIRVRRDDAGNRGAEVPGQPGERALRIHELTAEERRRFQRGYEQLYADAEGYYQRRPGAEPLGANNPRGAASPQRGRHATDLARDSGLVARHGDRVFEGTEAAVQKAAADYRREGYLVWMSYESDGRLTATVRSGGGDVELELRYVPDTDEYRAMPLDPYPPRDQDRGEVQSAYTSKLAELAALDARWEAQGASLEERARRAHAYRRRARLWAQDQGADAGDDAVLELRDLADDDPEGSSFEERVARGLKAGQTRDDVYRSIIGSAEHSNGGGDATYGADKGPTP